MGYRLNRLDEPVFMAVPKPMLTQLAFIIDWRVVLFIQFAMMFYGEILQFLLQNYKILPDF